MRPVLGWSVVLRPAARLRSGRLVLLLRRLLLGSEEGVLYSVREADENVAHGHVGGEELLCGDHSGARQSVEGVAHGATVGVGLVSDSAVGRRLVARTRLPVRRIGILSKRKIILLKFG